MNVHDRISTSVLRSISVHWIGIPRNHFMLQKKTHEKSNIKFNRSRNMVVNGEPVTVKWKLMPQKLPKTTHERFYLEFYYVISLSGGYVHTDDNK